MLTSLYSGVSALQQFQERMDVISNNIANVNTASFKKGRTDFADSFSQTLRSTTIAGGSASASGLQVGTGVTTSTVRNLFDQGSIASTTVKTDLAVNGDGFFVCKDVSTGQMLATRAGQFSMDAAGYLITNNGKRVQGFSDAALSTRGDIRIDATGAPSTAAPGATYKDFSIDEEGKITVKLSDDTEFTRGQILLQKFSDPQALQKEGGNLYSNINAAGPLGGAAAPTSAVAKTSGLGSIKSYSLEMSNVDLAAEFASMIETQRAYQASSKIITTSDEMMQEMVNLKR